MGKKKRAKYTSDMPHRLYSFFASYSDTGAPSFDKFARSVGLTLEDITNFRSKKEFDRAWRECNEIRRDYLIDNALAKRLDGSLCKFLLGCEFGMGDEKNSADGPIEVTVEVVDG